MILDFDSGEFPRWSASNAGEWTLFLRSETGRAFLKALAYYQQAPLPEEADAHAKLSRADRVAGFQRALEYLFALQRPIEPPKSQKDRTGEYPDIDDESLWPSPNQTN